MEHRCGTRHPVDFLVYVRSHGGAVSSAGRLSCISVSGGFIYTSLPAQPLSTISLRLVDAGGRLGESLEGHVIRRSPQGLGIEWSDDASGLIRDLIRLSLSEEIYPSRDNKSIEVL
jgi:hypothetical protein